jgi:UrcA family protein
MNKLTLLLLAASAFAIPALPAAAADAVVTKSLTVRYGDLNLGTDEGAQTLYRRIKLAAQKVCVGADTKPFGRAEFRKCVNTAVDDAVAKVDRPTLHLVHGAHKSPPMG